MALTVYHIIRIYIRTHIYPHTVYIRNRNQIIQTQQQDILFIRKIFIASHRHRQWFFFQVHFLFLYFVSLTFRLCAVLSLPNAMRQSNHTHTQMINRKKKVIIYFYKSNAINWYSINSTWTFFYYFSHMNPFV